MDLKLAACVIINRVYLSSDVGTICITEWAGGRMTAYLLSKGVTNG